MIKHKCALCGVVGGPGARSDNAWYCDRCLNSPQRTRGRRNDTLQLAVVGPDEQSEIERLRAENAALKAKYAGKNLSDDTVIFGKVIVRDDSEEGPIQLVAQDIDKAAPSVAEIEAAKLEAKSDPRRYSPTNEKTLKRIGAAVTDAGTTESEPTSTAGDEKPAAADKKPRAAHRSSARPKARPARGGRRNKAR